MKIEFTEETQRWIVELAWIITLFTVELSIGVIALWLHGWRIY